MAKNFVNFSWVCILGCGAQMPATQPSTHAAPTAKTAAVAAKPADEVAAGLNWTGKAPQVGLISSYSAGACTAVLLTPDVILSSGECMDGTSDVSFRIDSDADGVEHTVDQILPHPSYANQDWSQPVDCSAFFDVSLAHLSQPITGLDLPLYVNFMSNLAPPADGDSAPNVIAYDIESPTGNYEQKYIGNQTVLSVSSSYFQMGPGDPTNTSAPPVSPSYGDLGAPLVIPNGPMIFGIGSGWCQDSKSAFTYTRLDAVFPWISETVEAWDANIGWPYDAP